MLILLGAIIVIELAIIISRLNAIARSTELFRRHYLDVLNFKGISVWAPDGYYPLDSTSAP